MDEYTATELAYRNGYTNAWATIVRCKDCEQCENWNRYGATGFKCYLHCADVEPDDYCSYGIRRTAL